MKNYRVIMRAAGARTQLPDSQKVFGALITQYAKRNGDPKATEITRAVMEKQIHLALSNVLPLDYFPLPQDYVVDELAGTLSADADMKMKRASVKARAYVKWEGLQCVLREPGACADVYPYIRQSDGQQLRASMDSVWYGIHGLETRLYTVPVLNLQEVELGKGRKEVVHAVTDFCFYLQMDETMFADNIRELLEDLMEKETALILGKRASQGLNKYRITAIEEITLPKGNRYLNLGMLLPDRIDYQESALRIFTSERRPFSMPGGWNADCKKYFISFLEHGSLLSLPEGAEQAGKCVPSPFYGARDIVFGNAFLYPVKIREEGKA